MEQEKRFFIDDRAGCIAVRDRKLMDPDRQGLDPEMEDVVFFAMKTYIPKTCPTCGRHRGNDWELSPELMAKAQEKCDQMNAAAKIGEVVEREAGGGD